MQSQDNVPVAPETDWYVRPFAPEDEDGLLALYERAFRRPRDRRHWRWKLLGRSAPFNLLWVAAVPGIEADGGERIVGHYGGIPIRLQMNGQLCDAVHAVEAMTDPDFRRKGMLTLLGNTAHSTWASAGQVVVTGLPNDQWGTRNRVLGYQYVFPLSWLRFPLHLERALAKRESVPALLRLAGFLPALIGSVLWRGATRLRNSRFSNSITVELATADSTAFDEVWNRASQGWSNIQVRDNGWVRWRYLQAEPDPYSVAVAYARDREGEQIPFGYIAFRVVDHGERRNGYIADMLVPRDANDVAWALVNFAFVQLSKAGAGTVMTLASPGSTLHATFRRFGLLPTKAETAFSFEVVPLSTEVTLDEISNPVDWHLTGGDFDVI